MLRIASLVFAKPNDPNITAYGLLAQRHIDANADVRATLAESVASLKLGIPTGKNAKANVTMTSTEEETTVLTSVQASVLGDRVIFGVYHYNFATRDIESLFDGRIDNYLSESDKFFANIVAAVNARAVKGRDHE
jgi:hypothetical protein